MPFFCYWIDGVQIKRKRIYMKRLSTAYGKSNLNTYKQKLSLWKREQTWKSFPFKRNIFLWEQKRIFSILYDEKKIEKWEHNLVVCSLRFKFNLEVQNSAVRNKIGTDEDSTGRVDVLLIEPYPYLVRDWVWEWDPEHDVDRLKEVKWIYISLLETWWSLDRMLTSLS